MNLNTKIAIRNALRKVFPRYAFDRIFVPIVYRLTTIHSRELRPDKYPIKYHFLMNNYCNARCVFCNQISTAATEGKKTITLDLFKRMISNIPMSDAEVFYLSGGGEPLLTPDLFAIIEHLNTAYPHLHIRIKTNGLLVGELAESLARTRNCALDIAVHGTESVNNSILRVSNTADIFKGIERLNSILASQDKKMEKAFRPVVWKDNIHCIPDLVEVAASLKIDLVRLYLCRFSTTKEKLDPKDSLLTDIPLYYRIVSLAEKKAKSLGISFSAPPLMKEHFQSMQKKCPAPWEVMLIDPDGDVYPCPAWEVLAFEKVKSGKYNFGNVLKSHVRDFWRNPDWMELRHTRISCDKKGKIFECRRCPHNPFIEGATACRDE